MNKILIKLVTGILAVLTCNTSNATEIKLNCTYSTKISFTTSTDEKNESGSGIITITDQPWGLLIQISPADGHLNNFSVSTNEMPGKEGITNNSNDSTYELTNKTKCLNNCEVRNTTLVAQSTVQSIIIDRLTGKFKASTLTAYNTGTVLRIDSSGDCSKLDETKKKF